MIICLLILRTMGTIIVIEHGIINPLGPGKKLLTPTCITMAV